jgi:hypothetical protein
MAEALINHWGYAAIFAIVILGNLGLPVPEEGVLIFGGYLSWAGRLQFSAVVVVGILSEPSAITSVIGLAGAMGKLPSPATAINFSLRLNGSRRRADLSPAMECAASLSLVFFPACVLWRDRWQAVRVCHF